MLRNMYSDLVALSLVVKESRASFPLAFKQKIFHLFMSTSVRPYVLYYDNL